MCYFHLCSGDCCCASVDTVVVVSVSTVDNMVAYTCVCVCVCVCVCLCVCHLSGRSQIPVVTDDEAVRIFLEFERVESAIKGQWGHFLSC